MRCFGLAQDKAQQQTSVCKRVKAKTEKAELFKVRLFVIGLLLKTHTKQKTRKLSFNKAEFTSFLWSCLCDSNARPLPYQGSALPTELRQHMATRIRLELTTSSVTG